MSSKHTIIGTGLMLTGLLGNAITGTKSCAHFTEYGTNYQYQITAADENSRQRFEEKADHHLAQSGKWALYLVAPALGAIAGLLYRRRGEQ